MEKNVRKIEITIIIIILVSSTLIPFYYYFKIQADKERYTAVSNVSNTTQGTSQGNETSEEIIKEPIKKSYPRGPLHCIDAIYNEGEQGRDCGWTCPNECEFTEKCGKLKKSETWSGNILVTCSVEVPNKVTLTIKEGTVVKFKSDKDYKTNDKGKLYVNGGTIKALGTYKKRIWFTSNASEPMNGDWRYIEIKDSNDSEFDYVIVEFGEMGIAQFDSRANVSHSIIRWSNNDGLYAERSSPTFEYNLLYGNGYHEIALEQYSNVKILNNILRDGRVAIHHENSGSYIEGNYFTNYDNAPITAAMESSLTVISNKFENIGVEIPIATSSGATVKDKNNDYGDGTLSIPDLGFRDEKMSEINYIPGDPRDNYKYVYNSVDETRRVIEKIGGGLSSEGALEYNNGYLYMFSQNPLARGQLSGFIKINPNTSSYSVYNNNLIANPRGLTWDGEHFYVNDFSLMRIYKFSVVGGFVKIQESFDIPDKEDGGTSGLTSDDEYLYLISRDRAHIYKLEKDGDLSKTIDLKTKTDIGSGITWTGEHFWTVGGCEKGICKWDENWTFVNGIYPVAEGTLDLAWDGEYLWTIQSTCKSRDDAKIFKIEEIVEEDNITENN
ncbi:MAG: right-handed parallel beta-helix repeat-containing protein [Candidatus Woesearchaeota archaeon]|nr:MAG: right-handed parallel beta-helix repeat-containing protein [Candidatus Woesearchaeota archaeon]